MRSTLIILVCSFLWIDALGQLTVVKLYWGDARLNKEYGLSPVPPYDSDTSIVDGYLLPDSCLNMVDSIDKPVILVLYKNSMDSVPHQVGFYLNGELYGFLITWQNGELSRVNIKPGYDYISLAPYEEVEVYHDNYAQSDCGSRIRLLKRSIELELSCCCGRPTIFSGPFGAIWRITVGISKPSLEIEQVTYGQRTFQIFGFSD